MPKQLFTPLRYPGGKGKLAPFVAKVIETNGLKGGCYVEPFAGGASVALYLLLNGYVSSIQINDKDPAVASFWYNVVNNASKICDLIENTPVTIEEWRKQREVQKNKDRLHLSLDLAFSTLFLNRTNRSGIIWAGPIGGQSQEGQWKLDCRFNKSDLIKRIERIASYKDAIAVSQLDAIDLLQPFVEKEAGDTLIYLDPPYYVKGQGLYLNAYTHEDHELLSRVVEQLKSHWLVSYDNVSEILELYKAFKSKTYQLNYSVQRHTKGAEVLFWSKELQISLEEDPYRVRQS